jgi:hypothetical protein
MIRAHRGCVDIAYTALKDLDSVCALAANNRRTNARPKTGGIYSNLLSKRGAERRTYLLAKFLSRQQVYRKHCVGAASVKGCSHHDFFKKLFAMFKILSGKVSA